MARNAPRKLTAADYKGIGGLMLILAFALFVILCLMQQGCAALVVPPTFMLGALCVSFGEKGNKIV